MTTPSVFPRGGRDAATGTTPNAAQSPGAGATTHEADAATAAHFGAALSLLLGHVAHEPAVTPEPTKAIQPDGADAEGETTDESGPRPDAAIAAALASPLSIAPTPALTSTDPTDATDATDAHTIHREHELLVPEFRDRLDRVIARLESEFGYKVEVAETYRSQTRQNALYAQGRTDPGTVITWTRASNHTLGRAADLVIDGSYDHTLGYERLARIAGEEGLRTLGPRDPGHVELPSSSAPAAPQASAEDESSPNALRASVIARLAPSIAASSSIVPSPQELQHPGAPTVAPVARVSVVASVATVAQVAQVATVGAQAAPTVHAPSRGRDTQSAPGRGAANRRAHDAKASATSRIAPIAESPSAVNGEPATITASAGDTHGGVATPNDERPSRTRLDPAAARDGVAELLRQTRDDLMRAVAGSDPTASTPSPTREAASSGSIGHSDMSERIARLLKVQDAASDRPLSQVLLRLERPDGGVDRLRVDLRGNTVSATLDVADQSTADRMSANMKDLQHTLERSGFDTDSLTVRTVSRSVESAALSRAAGASVESDLQRTVGSSSSASTNTSSRDRGTRQDGERPSPDSQRQRSRREQKGER